MSSWVLEFEILELLWMLDVGCWILEFAVLGLATFMDFPKLAK